MEPPGSSNPTWNLENGAGDAWSEKEPVTPSTSENPRVHRAQSGQWPVAAMKSGSTRVQLAARLSCLNQAAGITPTDALARVSSERLPDAMLSYWHSLALVTFQRGPTSTFYHA